MSTSSKEINPTILATFISLFSSLNVLDLDKYKKLLPRNELSLNPFPSKPWFLRFCSTSLLKTPWQREKLLEMSNFTFSYSVFNPLRQLNAIFINFEITVICELFQFGVVQNIVIGLRCNRKIANFNNPQEEDFLTLYSINTHFDASTIGSF